MSVCPTRWSGSGLSSAEEVGQALARHLEIPYVGREEFPSSPPFLQRLSPQYMRQYRFCPLAVEDGVLVVACADPTDPTVVDELRGTLGLDVRLAVATETSILEAIERYFGAGSTAVQKVIETMGDDERGDEAGGEDLTSLRDMAFEAPVIRLVNLLIENAIKANASDIHIEPFEDRLRVRYRIDGVLFDAETPPKRLQAAIISRIKIMAKLNIAERRLPQDGRIRMGLEGRRLDLRVSTLPTLYGESVVMRLLDRAAILMPLDQLGFDERSRRAIERIIGLPHGMFLVTGPTGSGKTTTLYAALDKINSPDKKIITIEDPVEYQLHGVNQIHVKPKIGLTFAAGLRHIVRQDPDVIMVGEIRDRETADIAHPRRADRPPGLLDAAHQRRARRHHAPPRHGRGAVPDRVRAGGRAGPAPGAARSARAAASPTSPTRASCGPLGIDRVPADRAAVARRRLRRVPRHRDTEAARGSTSSWA